MIELDVKDYCQHGCMDFDPKVERLHNDLGGMVYISCTNAKRCEYMVRYLSKHANGENDNG